PAERLHGGIPASGRAGVAVRRAARRPPAGRQRLHPDRAGAPRGIAALDALRRSRAAKADCYNSLMPRVGVIFGGRSGEHEVSLASAASVIAALERRGHRVVPIGIARDGRWVVGGDPMRALAEQARGALPSSDETGAVKKALADRAEGVLSE